MELGEVVDALQHTLEQHSQVTCLQTVLQGATYAFVVDTDTDDVQSSYRVTITPEED